MNARITQKDIARRLNVSQSLVANVLNDRPGVWISQQNRARILSVARELGYRPHAAARALRQGKTHVAACVFFGVAGYDAVVERMADGIASAGYDLLVKVIPDPRQASTRVDNLLSGGVCDAVVLWGLEDEVEETAVRLQSAGVPFAVKGRFEDSHPGWPQADFDHEGMMRQAVEHLVRLGHQHIAYMGYDNTLVYAQCMRRGFQRAIEEFCEHHAPDSLIAAIGDNPADSAAAMKRWDGLADDERPTAVVMGVGRAPWQEIELWMAQRGQRIGEASADFALCGLGADQTPLLYGEAHAYFQADLADLAGALARRLLLPLLAGEQPQERILRLLPPLRPFRSLRLDIAAPARVAERQ